MVFSKSLEYVMADASEAMKEIKSSSSTSVEVMVPSAANFNFDTDSQSQGTISPQTPRSIYEKESEHHPSMPEPSSFSTYSSYRSDHHSDYIRQKRTMIQIAVSIIEEAWLAYRNKQMFRLLKHSVCAAEHSLTGEILRKMCPKEAEFFRDKYLPLRVRFRFGGDEFPPLILFKIYINTANGKGVKYFSGRKMIRPASEAAEDSLKLMGNRPFYDQMLQDALYQQQAAVVDEVDVTTLKDYMQYLSNLDETPAYLGGRENYWRQLSLDDLPRHTLFFDVVDFAYNQRMTPRLKKEFSLLTLQPTTQEMKIKHIEVISKLRISDTIVSTPTSSRRSGSQKQPTSRRSLKARMRAMKMRQLYGSDRQEATSANEEDYLGKDGMLGEETERDLDSEASQLYEWSKTLNINDDILDTPRVLSAAH